MCGLTEPDFTITIPLLISVFSIPLKRIPTLSPASPLSRILRNISTPVTVEVNFSSPIPTISTPSPVLITPASIRPVATVPRPVIENTSSIGIKNGLSTSLVGSAIQESTASINSSIFATHLASPFNPPKADPWITGALSPSYS